MVFCFPDTATSRFSLAYPSFAHCTTVSARYIGLHSQCPFLPDRERTFSSGQNRNGVLFRALGHLWTLLSYENYLVCAVIVVSPALYWRTKSLSSPYQPVLPPAPEDRTYRVVPGTQQANRRFGKSTTGNTNVAQSCFWHGQELRDQSFCPSQYPRRSVEVGTKPFSIASKLGNDSLSGLVTPTVTFG